MAKLPEEEPVPLYMRPQMVRSYIKVEISIKMSNAEKKRIYKACADDFPGSIFFAGFET